MLPPKENKLNSEKHCSVGDKNGIRYERINGNFT